MSAFQELFRLSLFLLILAGFLPGRALAQNTPESLPGFELRMLDYTHLFNLMPKSQSFDFPQSEWITGNLKEAKLEFKIPQMGFERNFLVLKNIRLSLSAKEWSFQQSHFLELKCLNPTAVWELGDLSLSPNQLREFKFFLSIDEQQKKTLRIENNFEKFFAPLLAPKFKEKALEKSLSLKAQCPSNMEEVLEGVLRAWLVDWPSKFPKSYKNWAKGLQEKLSQLDAREFKLDLLLEATQKLDPSQTPDLTELEITTKRSSDPRVLRWVPKLQNQSLGLEERLSAESKSLLSSGAPQSAGLELLGNATSLTLLTEYALKFSSTDFPIQSRPSPQSSLIEIESELSAADLVSVLPELKKAAEHNRKIKPLILFENCAEKAVFPLFTPFVSFDSFSHLELLWQANLEWRDAQTDELYSKRSLHPFWLRSMIQNTPQGKLDFRFEGAGMAGFDSQSQVSGPCLVQKSPVELTLTLDWLLKSDRFKNAMESVLSHPLNKAAQKHPARLRLLGVETEESKHQDQGFRSEAWVLQVQ